MAEPKIISIIEGEERWSASYEVDERGVCVSSAYGSDRAALGRKAEPDLVAKDLLRGLVQRWEPASGRRPALERKKPPPR